MVDRISGEIKSLEDLPLTQQQRMQKSSQFIDPAAFLDSHLDSPEVKRDKKRRRQIARKQMVEQGILPPEALNRIDWPE